MTEYWFISRGLTFKVEKSETSQSKVLNRFQSPHIAKQKKFNFHRLSFDFQAKEWS